MKSAQFTPFLDLNPSCPKEGPRSTGGIVLDLFIWGPLLCYIIYVHMYIYICDTCDCIEQPFQSNKHRGFTYIVKYIYSMYMLYIYIHTYQQWFIIVTYIYIYIRIV